MMNDDFCDDSSFISASTEDQELPTIALPQEEVRSLNRQHASLSRKPLMATIIERPPIACGIVKNIHLLGVFPTCRWMADPTMPPDVKELFGGTPFFPLGEYRVATLELLDAAGTRHPLIIIVNTGVEGLLTGYWGAAFGRDAPHPCWARFEQARDTNNGETIVKEERYSSMRPSFEEFDCLSFSEEYFEKGRVPGTCSTQLERIIGLAAEFLLELEWRDWLPDRLVETRDRSSKLERKRRAKIARQQAELQAAVDAGV
jgi:hypothetical protein